MKKIGFISAKRISPGCIEVTYTNRQVAGAQAAEAFFTADEACEVVAASESHTAKETTAPTLNIHIGKEVSGAAGGTTTTPVLTSGFDGRAAANTPQRLAGSATLANKQLAKGDRLSFIPTDGDIGGSEITGTQLVGVIITVELKYI
ncbi:hypothetical protein ES708_15522 [subsurface metagenome]